MTSPTETREAVARTLYEMAPFVRPDDPGAAMAWDELPEWARQNNRKRADILIAGPFAPFHAEIESLRETNRKFHRRLQSVEGPITARMQRGEREALFWLEARKDAGRRVSHELFRARRAEVEVSRLTAALAESERQRAVMRERAAEVCTLRASVWRHHIGKPSETSMDEQVASLFENAAAAIRALTLKEPTHEH